MSSQQAVVAGLVAFAILTIWSLFLSGDPGRIERQVEADVSSTLNLAPDDDIVYRVSGRTVVLGAPDPAVLEQLKEALKALPSVSKVVLVRTAPRTSELSLAQPRS